MNEAELKRDLALSCRILGWAGLGDALYGHVTGRLPGWDRFWMKPHGLGLEEVTEADLILVDMDGQVLAGRRPRHNEYPIHAEVMRRRPEVGAVVHTHPRHGVALAASGRRLARIGQDSNMFASGVPAFDEFSHLVTTREHGEAVATTMGDARALFLVNHGVVVAASDVAEVTCLALMLERACQIQLLAQATPDQPLLESSLEDAASVAAVRGSAVRQVFEYHARRLPPA